MARDRTTLWVLGVLAAIACAISALMLAPFLTPIAFALILAVAFEPLYSVVERRIRRPALAALAFTLLILALVLAPLTVTCIKIVEEARGMYTSMAAQSAAQGGWGEYAGRMVERGVDWVAGRTGLAAPNLKAAALDRAQWVTARLVAWSGSLLSNLTSTVGDALMTLFVLFFVFAKRLEIRRGIYRYMPLPRARTATLLETARDAIVANLYGIVAVGAAQGVLTGLGFLISGLPSPVFWGAAAAVCSLVPLVGAALVWLPAALYLLAAGFWGKALFIVLWGVLVVGMADNILRPMILAGRTEMNTLMVFFALMGGVQLFGFLGLFAGPVIFSLTLALVRLLREEYAAQESEAVE